MFISFEKLYLAEMRIYFEQSIANLFVNGLFEIKIQYTSVGNFSKGFYMFFFIQNIQNRHKITTFFLYTYTRKTCFIARFRNNIS